MMGISDVFQHREKRQPVPAYLSSHARLIAATMNEATLVRHGYKLEDVNRMGKSRVEMTAIVLRRSMGG